MLFSIITINFNNSDGLKDTIKSVINQKDADYEYIIIDGGSTDGSTSVIEHNNAQIAYWVSEPDKGIYHAMNKGIKASKGEYLLFLNSGDIFKNETILKQATHECSHKLDIYYGDLEIEKNGKFIRETYPETLTFSYFYHKGYLPHPSTFIKRDLFYNIYLYNENFKIVGDWDFLVCAICKYNATYKHIDFVVSKYKTDGISSNSDMRPLLLKEKQLSLSNNFPLFLDDSKELVTYRSLFKISRYKLLHKLETNSLARKINSAWLYMMSFVFKAN